VGTMKRAANAAGLTFASDAKEGDG
jgi:hypothetical protein